MPDRPDLFDDLFGFPDDDFAGMPRRTRARHTAARHPMPCPPLGILLAYADENDTSITPRRRRAHPRARALLRDVLHEHVERGFDEVLHGVHEILKDAYDVNQAALRRRESRFQQALHVQIKQTAPPLGSHYPLDAMAVDRRHLAVDRHRPACCSVPPPR